MVVKKPEDVDKIEVPDPEPYMSAPLEALEIAVSKNMYSCAIVMGGWVSAAAYSITEPETFLFWMLKRPELAHKILDLSAEYAIRQAEVYVKRLGTEGWIPWDANPTDSNTLFGSDFFEKIPSTTRNQSAPEGIGSWNTNNIYSLVLGS
ncbi:MAG: uroporphyrinogen decarboxylase family protein [Candidatus Bathyarchaeia archaeon]